MSSRVELYINLKGLAPDIAHNVAAAIAARVTNLAKATVRVSTESTVPGGPHGTLRNMIQRVPVSKGHFMVIADTEYAAAQEWGLAKFGKPKYGFTPYMRPSAKEVTKPSVFNPIAKDAVKGAIEKNRIRSQR